MTIFFLIEWLIIPDENFSETGYCVLNLKNSRQMDELVIPLWV